MHWHVLWNEGKQVSADYGFYLNSKCFFQPKLNRQTMLTTIEATSTPFNKQHFVKSELLLKNHPVIQNCIGMQSSGFWYTDDIQMLFVRRGAFQLSYGGHTFVVG
jgi:hypothetical protein